MPEWVSRIFNLTPYPGLIERQQAIAAYAVSLGTLLLSLPLIWASLIFRTYGSTELRPADVLLVAAMVGLILAAWWLVHQGQLNAARWLLLANSLLVGVLSGVGSGWVAPGDSVGPSLLIVVAALLTNERGVLVATAVAIVGIGIVSLSVQETVGIGQTLSDFSSLSLVTLAVGGLSYLLAQGWQRSLTRLGEQASMQRLRMVELSNEVAQRIFRRTDEDTLLAETVNLVRDHFEDIYHAQIFLIDEEGRDAVLRASTGPAGQELLKRGHKLAVGSQSVIGQVTQTGRPVLARDTSRDPVHRANELLPNTRAELALPLVSGTQIIGALDVQSTRAAAFTPDDADVLQTLANQVAIAIDNARLFTAQQRVIAENQRLVEQAQHQLAQIEALNRRLTRRAWEDYLQAQDLSPALTIDFSSGSMTPNAQWTDGLQTAAATEALVQADGPDQRRVAVPLRLRGQVIGAMELELEGESPLSADEAALVQDVADRLSLSLESARLYENAQQMARREAVINAIGARLQSAAGMDSALAIVAQSLQTALNAPRVAIRLGRPPSLEAGADGPEEEAAP